MDAVAYPYRAQGLGEGEVGTTELGRYVEEALLSPLGDEALAHALAQSSTSSSTSASRTLLGMFDLASNRSGEAGRQGGAGGGGTVGPLFLYQRSEESNDEGGGRGVGEETP